MQLFIKDLGVYLASSNAFFLKALLKAFVVYIKKSFCSLVISKVYLFITITFFNINY